MCSKEGAPGYGIVKECRIQYHYGQEYWGNFMKSLYTLFQVLTGESWSEAVARPILFGWLDHPHMLINSLCS